MCSGRGETQCIISDDSGDFSFSESWIGKARSLGSASPGHMHLAMRLHTVITNHDSHRGEERTGGAWGRPSMRCHRINHPAVQCTHHT